jgi:hypothetical protein
MEPGHNAVAAGPCKVIEGNLKFSTGLELPVRSELASLRRS